MDKTIPMLIRRRRIELRWSQESLCKGICAVSYLSKVENGQIEASAEIEKALLERLGLETLADDNLLEKARSNIERFYSDRLDFRNVFHCTLSPEEKALLGNSRYFLDVLLMSYSEKEVSDKEVNAYISLMDDRQKKKFAQLQVFKGILHPDDFIDQYPEAFSYFIAGQYCMFSGRRLYASWYYNICFNLAGQTGDLLLMIMAKIGIHICYVGESIPELAVKELRHIEKMTADIREPLAILTPCYYNTANCFFHIGRLDMASEYLNKCSPQWMDKPWLLHHKRALLHELDGDLEKAAKELEKSRQYGTNHPEIDIVQYRLDHPDYVKDAEYEKLLRQTLNQYELNSQAGMYAWISRDLETLLEKQFRYKEAMQQMKKRILIGKNGFGDYKLDSLKF